MNLLDLDECSLEHILRMVPFLELGTCRAVCVRLRLTLCSPELWLPHLHDEEKQHRLVALRALSLTEAKREMLTLHKQKVLWSLDDPEPIVRREALLSVARLRWCETASAPLIAAKLHDHDMFVRQAAVQVLGEFVLTETFIERFIHLFLSTPEADLAGPPGGLAAPPGHPAALLAALVQRQHDPCVGVSLAAKRLQVKMWPKLDAALARRPTLPLALDALPVPCGASAANHRQPSPAALPALPARGSTPLPASWAHPAPAPAPPARPPRPAAEVPAAAPTTRGGDAAKVLPAGAGAAPSARSGNSGSSGGGSATPVAPRSPPRAAEESELADGAGGASPERSNAPPPAP
eukprot:CAMPEP_0118923058 /NCGR_PEP_ID=MMETSP1169-20130426/1734_1 /TAXON_ID=36882 /ORGANISM="Pyramimonas obovata, Strain CCMP722" /LENGTH=349 /DNA_ID=CAMNT_0006863999 /DNA_START=594 /DNA_END=1639 /DNA_ORIENTATION=+